MFALSPTPSAVLDKHHAIIVISNSWSKLANVTSDRLRGKNFLETIGVLHLPTDHNVTAQLIQDAIASRKEQKTEPIPGPASPGHLAC